MNSIEYWSKETNPATGAKFEAWYKQLDGAHNGKCDMRKLISGEYGSKLTQLANYRFTFEDDPMGEECLAFYRAHGVKKEMFETADFYTRWVLFTPLDMVEEAAKGKKYPLIFFNHGGANSIETDEFGSSYSLMVGTEKFIVAMLQNTNWENSRRVLDLLEKQYPIDNERVYMTGFSQGGETTGSAAMRMPERFAAVAPCGSFIFRTFDNMNVRYTIDEYERYSEVFLPMMMIVEGEGISRYAPVNDWYGRPDWSPMAHDPLDPTNPNGRKCDRCNPRPGVNVHRWMISRLNMLLNMLGCDKRDEARCISYINIPEDELHHAVGFYGDKEETRLLLGCKHYMINMQNRDGINALRYCVVENSPHMVPTMLAELTWEFFSQFRRDAKTGKIVTV